ncbi:MAG TPA: chromate transporter [Eoetvoesiella sp.]
MHKFAKPISNPPSLMTMFWAFARIGVTSFGGGLSGWMMREFVIQRRWISEEEFLSGLALSQAFPGINVVNLSIWIGYRLRGGQGAFVASLGMVVPAMFVAISMAAVFSLLRDSPSVHYALAGIAAAAIGLSLEMGIHAAKRAVNGLLPILIMAATFVSIFIFDVSLIWVVLCAAPCSVAVAWYRENGKPKWLK